MMGQSGGRSQGHPVGAEALRKNTPRERQQIDPPWDQRVPQYRLTTRGERVRDAAEAAASYLLCFGLGAFGGGIIGFWFTR